ncbi:MAG: ATPase P, partial [Armatimonadota bacterium]|nr:ATPase P [Armatimonadota bacterium]
MMLHDHPSDVAATPTEPEPVPLEHTAAEHSGHPAGSPNEKGQAPIEDHDMPAQGASDGAAHHGMDHGSNDPEMAKGMEADIRRRFWVSLVLSVAIVLLSPMGAMIGVRLPIGPAVRSWTLLVLTTPVVFWCGWMFISGAYGALRSRKLDMSVLIAVGILAAYLASFYLTIIGSKDLFYEAAAMLVTFVLFGHWMEMKSRHGTSNALRALFDLAPAKAHVRRDGKEIEIATAEVVKGDLLVLRPGDRVPVD